jgi:hypothetical protein
MEASHVGPYNEMTDSKMRGFGQIQQNLERIGWLA